MDPQTDSYDIGGAVPKGWGVLTNDPYDTVGDEGAGMKEEPGRTMFSCINGNGIIDTSLLLPC